MAIINMHGVASYMFNSYIWLIKSAGGYVSAYTYSNYICVAM